MNEPELPHPFARMPSTLCPTFALALTIHIEKPSVAACLKGPIAALGVTRKLADELDEGS
jgi:hypothetical protein